ncbi:basic secretory family protein [Niabella sp. CC-SYL272]|uniref:basic secretory family protein n=1 Tax=Niabella agricola TaxID=2891571 RepID=UPI001F22D11E|nr:basic secretory family protein [Niabella agricola]MCF3111492.1 basic secretory family protein [Niabella agricola]
MKYWLLLAGIFIGSHSNASAISPGDSAFNYGSSRFEKGGFVLYFTSNETNFNEAVKKKMVDAFFTVYPILVKDFNSGAAKEVYFKVDTAYHGVAATGGGKVVYDPVWFAKHPGDVDVVTHEVMHIVQDYGNSVGPWWITEGIADYVRFKYGVDNNGAGWKLPAYSERQKYSDGYRVTARFLAWIDARVKSGTVKALDKALRNHTYTADSWKEITGNTLDDLWKAYSKDPVL